MHRPLSFHSLWRGMRAHTTERASSVGSSWPVLVELEFSCSNVNVSERDVRVEQEVEKEGPAAVAAASVASPTSERPSVQADGTSGRDVQTACG